MLEPYTYCPVLRTRISEVKALLNLPASSKDRMFPVLVARPWPNAKFLQRTWDKIEEAVEDRPFALDLDPMKQGVPTGKPAATEFDALFHPANGFSNYYDLLADIGNAVPVFQFSDDFPNDAQAQVDRINRLGRGAILRVQNRRAITSQIIDPDILDNLENYTILVDAGWSDNLLLIEAWCSGIINQITDYKPEAEIIVAGSSFPESFTNIVQKGDIPVVERDLFARLVRRHNAAILTYGDWGSTRPPVEPRPMKIVKRIDLPRSDDWLCYRQIEEENYEDIAERIVSDADWPTGLAIWGTFVIDSTANNLPGAIRSPATAAAARINIHLHMQSQYGAGAIESDTEEPFTDL